MAVCALLRPFIVIALTISFESALAADPSSGKALVTRWCTSCHLVEPNQKGPTSEAPPFTEVAKLPGFSADKLAFFLLDPHPKMPDMGLSRIEAANIAAYIETLIGR
jgi:mono/diheme cytochrome c family protein